MSDNTIRLKWKNFIECDEQGDPKLSALGGGGSSTAGVTQVRINIMNQAFADLSPSFVVDNNELEKKYYLGKLNKLPPKATPEIVLLAN